jgi:hypothetical protein
MIGVVEEKHGEAVAFEGVLRGELEFGTAKRQNRKQEQNDDEAQKAQRFWAVHELPSERAAGRREAADLPQGREFFEEGVYRKRAGAETAF